MTTVRIARYAANGDPQIVGTYPETEWTPPGPYVVTGALADEARCIVARCYEVPSLAQARAVVAELLRAGAWQPPLL
jgi:hypothetical protein